MIIPTLVTTLLVACQEPVQDAPPATGFPGLGAGHVPRVEIPWNRLYDYEEIYAHMDRLAAAWPELVSYEVIGHSVESREMRVYTLNNPATGADTAKPAMWVDGNIHGNEVQGGEAVVYLLWYLLENHGTNPAVTELVDRTTFYLFPMVNPDGRAHWFRNANTASTSRSGVQPTDNDRDGLFDEDGPDDLDGDGHIVRMRKYVPGDGNYRLDPDDPRVMIRVPRNDRGIRGDWNLLGSEGIDNDGDGRINEDGIGGYDMNRAWPSSWQPDFAQYGAGPYPLYWPETRCMARFLVEHPNVAAVQSFHNSGGMILRGPGVESYGSYPRADLRVYDALGADGEKMLPFYRYMIIWKDLYSVFGGSVTWAYEALGIISFSNELWTSDRNSPDERLGRSSEDRHFFDDTLLMGAGFVDWHPYDHPLYGEVELGGFKKDVGRVPPTFLIEEMLHRNALFCIRHAVAMPEVGIDDPELTALGDGLTAVDVVFRNTAVMPTRTQMAADKEIGRPDVLSFTGEGLTVLAGGIRTDRYRPERISLAEHEPARLLRERGIPGHGEVRVRWLVQGSGTATIAFTGEKAADVAVEVTIP
jgi:hypothetical protein